jgi:prolyl 4-hydroxylase
MLLHLLPLPLLVLLATAASAQNHTCPPHFYDTHILSLSPLVIYIPDFITPSEASHIQLTSANKLKSSRIADGSGQHQLASTRTSRSTSLELDDIVRCIEERALRFQGFDTPRSHLEPLQAVHYSIGNRYHAHTDWFTAPSQITGELGGNRLTSFFIYVSVSPDIKGGGTHFPFLEPPTNEKWCQYINCDAPLEEGVTFRPVERGAVFWRNLLDVSDDGKVVKVGEAGRTGDRRTLHAGLPIQRGSKLGMNIWTREGALDERYRSG